MLCLLLEETVDPHSTFFVNLQRGFRQKSSGITGKNPMTKPPYSASKIAKYFLFKGNSDEELISNLKLQKLVYYAQGLHIALKGTPLFKENIEAWEYGPVVPELYSAYKSYGAGGIPPDDLFNPESIDSDTREYLDEVYSVFGQFSAVRLIDISHTDQCWKDAYPNGIIKHKAMETTLKKYIKHGEK